MSRTNAKLSRRWATNQFRAKQRADSDFAAMQRNHCKVLPVFDALFTVPVESFMVVRKREDAR